jgi:glucose/mannose transport system substrate-binding protein
MPAIFKNMLRTFLFAVLTAGSLPVFATTIDMMHYWASISEYGALSVMRTNVLEQGHQISGSFQTGSGGESNRDILTQKALTSDVPDAAFVKGSGVSRWARLGFLEKLSDIPGYEAKANFVYPSIAEHMSIRGDSYAIPISLHRTNLVFSNTKVLSRFNIQQPRTWDQLLSALKTLQENDVTPVVIGNESWQLATIYEALVFAEAGAEIYRSAFVEHNLSAFKDPAFAVAFDRLTQLQQYLEVNVSNKRWYKASEQFYNNQVGFLIGGDWYNGELSTVGYNPIKNYECFAMPGTENSFIYSLDSVALFKQKSEATQQAQFELANLLIDKTVQSELNLVKGSIPPRADVQLSEFNECATKSAELLKTADKNGLLLPSLANGMSTSPFVTSAYLSVLDEVLSGTVFTPDEFQKHLRTELKRAQYLIR